jgi:hypothetical protein
MVKCGVFFAVRPELLNVIWTIYSFKGLIKQFSVPEIETNLLQELGKRQWIISNHQREPILGDDNKNGYKYQSYFIL